MRSNRALQPQLKSVLVPEPLAEHLSLSFCSSLPDSFSKKQVSRDASDREAEVRALRANIGQLTAESYSCPSLR